MSSDLLVDIPGTAFHVSNISSSAQNLGLRAPTIILFPDSILLVNGETGTLYRKYTLPSAKDQVKDCIYLSQDRAFVALLEDSSILLIPESSKSPKEYKIIKWPIKPIKLIHVNENEFYLVGEQKYIALLSMKNMEISIPSSDKQTFFEDKKESQESFQYTHYDQTLLLAYFQKISSKVKSSKAQTLQVVLYTKPKLSSGQSIWCNEQQSESTQSYSISFPENESIQIVNVFLHEDCKAYSLLLQNNKSLTLIWKKFDWNGKELFSRELISTNIIHTFSLANQLWILTKDYQLIGYNMKYGMQSKQVAISISSTAGVVSILPCLFLAGPEMTTLACLTGITTSNQTTGLFLQELGNKNDSSRNTLMNMLNMDAKKRKIDVISSSSQTTNLLDQFSSTEQSQLLQYKKWYFDSYLPWIFSEESISFEKKKKNVDSSFLPALIDINKLDQSLVNKFLLQFDSISSQNKDESPFEEKDWEIIKALVILGYVSIQTTKQLIRQVLLAQKYEILSYILRYVNDLTEAHIVTILNFCLNLSNDSLNSYAVTASVVEVKDLVPSKPEASSSSSLSNEEKKKPTKETKSNKKSKKDPESEESSNDKDSLTQIPQLVQYIQHLYMQILNRQSGLSLSLLSEAIQNTLNSQSSTLFLRILILFFHDFSSLSSIFASYSWSDLHLQRMIDWLQALLDGQFTTLVIQANQHEYILRALQRLIQLVQTQDEVVSSIETILGFSKQLERKNMSTLSLMKSKEVYQIEQLCL